MSWLTDNYNNLTGVFGGVTQTLDSNITADNTAVNQSIGAYNTSATSTFNFTAIEAYVKAHWIFIAVIGLGLLYLTKGKK